MGTKGKTKRWSTARPVLTFGLLALMTQSGACTIMVQAQLPPGPDGGAGAPGNGDPGNGNPGNGNPGNGNPGTGGDGGAVDPGNTNPDPQNPNLPARGMSMPWEEHQAEEGTTNATVLGPSREKWDANHIEAEAVGRKAVKLSSTGQFVSFKSVNATNSFVVRFSIPDSPNGGGMDATLGLYINGTRVKDLKLTSHYSWSYQGFALDIPANTLNKPGAQPHTFFDEIRLGPDEFPNGIPAGAEIKLQRDAQDTAAFYVIDLVDLEQVGPPLTMPAGFVSVESFGVIPNDPANTDYADKVLAAIGSTPKLWFPKGKYRLDKISAGNVGLDNPGHEIRGAGMWYTELDGAKTMFFCVGATQCVFGDFSIRGSSTARNEAATMSMAGYDKANGDGLPQKAFAGPMGVSSLIENLWIEHTVAGIWVGNDPANQPTATDKLTIRNVRIRNTYADGVNLDNGTTNSTVENCHMRNTGDDSVAVWSIKWTDWVRRGHYPPAPAFDKDQGVEHGNVVKNVSVQMPWRANCFALYGGNDEHFENLSCEDVLTYPGILVDNEFSVYPFGSTMSTFKNISVIRAGGPMFFETTANPWKHGAVKLYMREGDVSDVSFEDIDIVDPTYSGIEFRGYGTGYLNGEQQLPDIVAAADVAKISNVLFKDVRITNAGTNGIEAVDGASRGSAKFQNVSVTGSVKSALSKGTAPDAFFDKSLGGNTGW